MDDEGSKDLGAVTGTKFNLDMILSELGSFGKYHVLMLFLLAFRDSFLSMCNLNYVLITAKVDYRCHVPECEAGYLQFEQPWLHNALPNSTGQCSRFLPVNDTSQHSNLLAGFEENDPNACGPGMFDRSKLIGCDQWVYADNDTMISEFKLGCQEWKRTLLGTVHNVGLTVSLILSGLISDRYGRKMIIVGTPLVVGIFGLAKSFSTDFWMLVILEFIETAFGYGNASLVLSLESVSHDRRVVFSCILDMLGNFGGMFFGLIAWLVPNWRHLLRVIYAPLLIVVFYIFLVDEGVRWLLAKGKKKEAIKILNKVAKFNNIELSNAAKDMMETITASAKLETNKEEGNKVLLIESLKSKTIWLRLVCCSFCFMCSSLVFYGLIINSTSLSGSKYLNFSLVMLVSIPTRILTAVVLSRFGRKVPMAVAYFMCAVFCVSSAFVPKDLQWLSTTLFLLAKMAISFGFYTLTVYTMEVFPTCARNSLTNISGTIGRVGSIVAPQTQLLMVYMDTLPNLVFALAALAAGSLMLFMPDTFNCRLPDDLREAENIDQLKKGNEKAPA